MMRSVQNHRSFEEFVQVLFSAAPIAPLQESNMQPVEQPPPAHRLDASRAPAKALLVEDVEFHLDRLASMLRLVGFDTLTAATGNEALRVAQLHSPRLIVIDWVLPDTNGLVLAHAIRRLEMPQPVIIGTATLLSREVRELALSTGIDSFCEKPVSLPALVQCLKSLRLLDSGAEIDEPGRSLELRELRRLSRGKPGKARDVYRAFIEELMADSRAVVDLARAGNVDGVSERAARLLGRASLVGQPDFVDVVRAIQRAAESRQFEVTEELAHSLDQEARSVVQILEQALCDDKQPA